MEIIFVWNNARSFQRHVADMKRFSDEHKDIPANESYLLKDMPMPGNFQSESTRGGGKIQISPRRRSTLVPLWKVEPPKGVQN